MFCFHRPPSQMHGAARRRLLSALAFVVAWLAIGTGALGTVSAQPAGAPTAAPPASPATAAPPAKPPAAPSASANAQPAKPPATDPVAPKAEDPADAAKPTADDGPTAPERLRTRAGQIRALIKGELDVAVDPRGLFPIDVTQAAEIELEAARLRALLTFVDELAKRDAEADADAPADDASAAKPPTPNPTAPKPDAPASDETDDGAPRDGLTADDAVAAEYVALRERHPQLFEARVELDRAELAFYELPEEERSHVLQEHAKRQAGTTVDETEKQLSEAEQRAADAEVERQDALRAAELARTEAERLVAEERARLAGVAKDQAELESELIAERQRIEGEMDEALALQREVQDAIAQHGGKPGSRPELDAMYRSLTGVLVRTRDELDEAIGRVVSDPEGIPGPGEDRLQNLPADVGRREVDAIRADILAGAENLRTMHIEVDRLRAQSRMRQVELLNDLRLTLLDEISPDVRSQITSFDGPGRKQAAAELRQVILTLRYNLLATTSWWEDVQREGDERGSAAWAAVLLILRTAVPIAVFIWWRRRADRLLQQLRNAVVEYEHKRRRGTGAGPLTRAVGFLQHVRKSVEWLVFVLALDWILPESVRSQLEVQLVFTALSWLVGGALVVEILDAWLDEPRTTGRRAKSTLHSAHLRLRSLRLIGRAVVTVGLVLAISDELVGEGTIYSWVLSTCWFAALPMTLVLVRWWKPIIFERVELLHKKTAFDEWTLKNPTGAISFVAALAAGGVLMARGAFRWVRAWVVKLTLTRRVLAYLFRRGLSKKAQTDDAVAYEPIDAKAFERLGPDMPSKRIVPSVADALVGDVIERINAPGGGVFAIVGERGAGKTTTMQQIAEQCDDTTVLSCPRGSIEQFRQALIRSLSLSADTTLEQAAKHLDEIEGEAGLIVDDAHHLIEPRLGGFDEFDRLLAMARLCSTNCCWILTFDESMWRLLEQARGALPLFDGVIRLDPWTEEGIAGLLKNRSKQIGLQASFEPLLSREEKEGDPEDREEALEAAEANYYRLLWDYAAGNPGVALHAWRNSLGIDADGQTVVKLFGAPDAKDLASLPEATVFVLRAIVQLGWADAAEIAGATSLPRTEVLDALRYGMVRGYFEHREGRYHITWDWFRAVTRLLWRRHLIFYGA